MCDYSLHNVASRPAQVGDRLATTTFARSCTRGFAAVEQPDVAVCLRPGTELAFEDNVQYETALSLFRKSKVLTQHKVARFRQIDVDNPNVHHDALEFPDGRMVMVTRLTSGQRVTVLQLPVSSDNHGDAKPRAPRPARIAMWLLR
jgi:hypothetical protein